MIFKINLSLLIGIFKSSYDNVLRRTPQNLTDDKSTLVQVMAWCRQATSHYLSQCWARSPMPYGVTRPQWVKYYTCTIYLMRIKVYHESDFVLIWIWILKWLNSSLWFYFPYCLTAPSHHLNLCWLVTNEIIRNTSQCVSCGNTLHVNKNAFKDYMWKGKVTFPVARELTPLGWGLLSQFFLFHYFSNFPEQSNP